MYAGISELRGVGVNDAIESGREDVISPGLSWYDVQPDVRFGVRDGAVPVEEIDDYDDVSVEGDGVLPFVPFPFLSRATEVVMRIRLVFADPYYYYSPGE
jgi:hypothetical protein